MTWLMPKPRLPYLLRETTRHGRSVWYVRKGSGPRIRIRATFGTKAFNEEYQAALLGATIKGGYQQESLAWLVEEYRGSTPWRALAHETRKQREVVFRQITEESGTAPFKGVERKHIVRGVERRADRPGAARHFLEAMRGLFKWAADLGHVPADPTAGVTAPKKSTSGHHTWTAAECRKFEERWPLGTRERVAYDVLSLTGMRRGDAVRLSDDYAMDGVVVIVDEKNGADVAIPISPVLEASLRAGPVGKTTWIAGERGGPLTKESFGNWFGEACRAAGVPGRAHGLRKARATAAAEAGATEHELMAMFGWAEPRTAAIYTRKANRKKMAVAAVARMVEELDLRGAIPAPRTLVPHRHGQDVEIVD